MPNAQNEKILKGKIQGSYPTFASEVYHCAVNLSSEFIFRFLFGDFFRSFRKPRETGLSAIDSIDAQDLNLGVYDIAMIGDRAFLRSTGPRKIG